MLFWESMLMKAAASFTSCSKSSVFHWACSEGGIDLPFSHRHSGSARVQLFQKTLPVASVFCLTTLVFCDGLGYLFAHHVLIRWDPVRYRCPLPSIPFLEHLRIDSTVIL